MFEIECFVTYFFVIFDDWDVEKGSKVLSGLLLVMECCVLLRLVLARLYDSGLAGIVCNRGLARFLEIV